MLYQLNLREVTYALSESLDYVGVDDIQHGKRVAYIACEIGKKLGWRQSKLDKIMLMAMLHDCGVTLTDAHHSIMSHLDWEDSQLHCAKGAHLLQSVPIYSEFSKIIAFHHTHWEQFLPQIEDEVKVCANLLFLSDRIDALRSQFGAHLSHEKEYIRSIIQKYTPQLFAPQVSDAFLEISHEDFFWYSLESDPLHYYLSAWVEKGKIETVPFDLLKSIACMFAEIVDAKEHRAPHSSLMIASLAQNIAELCHFSLREQEEIELAALVQNLGKLRIPDAILGKNTSLSDDERMKIKRQGFDTQIILHQIKGFEYITKIISFYYKEIAAQNSITCQVSAQNTLPVEAAILMMANTFHMLQNDAAPRAITCEKIDAMINAIAQKSHQLEAHTLDDITSYLKSCYAKEG